LSLLHFDLEAALQDDGSHGLRKRHGCD
jgi:hypothetical protein